MTGGRARSSPRRSRHAAFTPRNACRREIDCLELGRGPVSALPPLELPSSKALPFTARTPKRGTSEGRAACDSRPGTAPVLTLAPVQRRFLPGGSSYDGQWDDCRMHGRGTLKMASGGWYDGEFCKGLMHGRGERLWPCGRLYRGEWRQDMPWGSGEMSFPSASGTGSTYTGQMRRGMFQGHGSRVWSNGDKYVGAFEHGEQEGFGVFQDGSEGWVFEGQWFQGHMYGDGRIRWADGTTYVGDWRDSFRDGRGRLDWPDGAWFEGPFRYNRVEGYGTKGFADGAWYEGEFIDGEFEGHGTFHWPDGTDFEGLWRKSEIVGPGCHRFPRGTQITGTFTDGGASGEGQKEWPGGCVYTGLLVRNCIGQYGTFKWSDGRSYVGSFEDDAMHGEGTLVWTNADGACNYRGQFRHNICQGHGVLEWSNGARYTGQFYSGLYHGQGRFEWPNGNVYRGSWVAGEMSGRGELTCACPDECGPAAGRFKLLDSLARTQVDADDGDNTAPSPEGDGSFTYVGSFYKGHMEGKGLAKFHLPLGEWNEYKGDFRASRFNGLGIFCWSTGHTLEGLFEDGYCSRIGKKVYPDGHIYAGELLFDFEHGKGIMYLPKGSQMAAIWNKGVLVKEVEGGTKDFDMDSVALPGTPSCSDDENAEAKPSRSPRGVAYGRKRPPLPVNSESGVPVHGKGAVLFLNGDRYIGHFQEGRKHGLGMYVYADLTSYAGIWCKDVLNGLQHPMSDDALPVDVRLLHELTEADEATLAAVFDSMRSEDVNKDSKASGLLSTCAHELSTQVTDLDNELASKTLAGSSLDTDLAGHMLVGSSQSMDDALPEDDSLMLPDEISASLLRQ